jgi:PAS domain S-box-containing protein
MPLTQREIWLQDQQNQIIEALNVTAMVSITDTDGKIIFVNEKFCKECGYTPKELLGNTHSILKSGIHPDCMYEEMWNTITSGKIWTGEVCNKNKDGKFSWFNATIVPFKDHEGHIEKYVAIRNCITELKEKEAELLLSRFNFEQVFNLAPDPYLIFNHEGIIINCNEAAFHLLEYSKNELISKNVFDLNVIPKKQQSFFKKSLKQTHDKINTLEFEIFSKSNREITIEIALHNITLSGSKLVLSICRDVTERNKINSDLKKKTNDLELFIYRASHDMKGPFTTMEGLLNLLKDNPTNADRDEILKMMGLTLKSGKSVLDNLNAVRSILKGPIKKQRIHFRTFIKIVLDELTYMDNFNKVNFHLNIPEDFNFSSNTFLLRSIFFNLIQNAIKFCDTANDVKTPTIKLRAFKTESQVVFQLIDNGIGIKDADQKKVFDFYQLNHFNKESGLGLYITQNAVSRLGGQMSLTSYEQQFTKFEIKLPIE